MWWLGRENPGYSPVELPAALCCYPHLFWQYHTPITLLPTTVYTWNMYTFAYSQWYMYTHLPYYSILPVPLCIITYHYLIKLLLCCGTVPPTYVHVHIHSAGNVESPNMVVCLAPYIHVNCIILNTGRLGEGTTENSNSCTHRDCVVTRNVVKEGHLSY